MRSFFVFEDLATAFNAAAQDSPILNHTNPLTPLTDVLSRLCTAPVVGLCHGLFENIQHLARIYSVAEEELSLRYAGVNHFFWTDAARISGQDLLADLQERVAKAGLTAVLAAAYATSDESAPTRELASELFISTGVMPYFGDRHTCEFFPHYITDQATMVRFKLTRTMVVERWAQRAEQRERVAAISGSSIPAEYRSRSRETAADIIRAHHTGRSFIDVGNLPNRGQVGNLPARAVVETAMRVDANGFAPLLFGDLPASVLPDVDRWARVFTAGVDACLARDRGAALQALRLDPVCSHLSATAVRELGERLLAAHQRFLPDWLEAA